LACNNDLDPVLKQKAHYSLRWAEAAYGLHVRDQGGGRNTRNRDIQLLRLYAQGRQPVDKYLDILCPKGANGKRRTYLDLSLDPLSVIPKFRSIVIGKFLRLDHEIIAEAIDENSGGERRNMRHKLWSKSIIEKELAPFKELMNAGVELSSAEKVIPKSIEELDMLQNAGNFKLKWEIGMEKLIKDSFHLSDWRNIKYRCYEDLFDTAMMATKDYTDKQTGKAMAKYVDIEKIVVRYSKEKNYQNIDYCGEIIDFTPNDIRIESGGQIPDDVIEKIVEENRQSVGIDYTYNNDAEDFYNNQGNISIKVLHLTWKSLDTIKQEKVTKENGDTYFNNVGYDFEEQRADHKVETGKLQMVYSCKWIIGTNYVWDFGHETDIVRPTPDTVKLPYNIYKISDKSMLELMIPSEDNIQLTWLKFQNALAKAKPPGIAVDVGVLENIYNGKNLLEPLEILQIVRETGDLIFKSTTHHHQTLGTNSTRPIFDLPGGAGKILDEYIKIINWDIDMIRNLTGLNELMDSSTPPPNTLVGTAEIAQEGTNNTLHIFYNGYRSVKEATASNLAYRIQSILRYQDYNPYKNIVGDSLLSVFKQGSPISASSYGIQLRLKPTGKDKQMMVEKATHAYEKGIIKFSDLMYLEQEIENGSIKKARIFITYREEKYFEEQQKITAANTQAQSEAIKEQAELASGLRINEAKELSADKMKEMAFRAGMDVQEYAAKHNLKLAEDDNKSKNTVKENLLS